MQKTPVSKAFARPWPSTRRGLVLWMFSIGFIFIGGVQFIGTEVPDVTKEYLAFAFDFLPAHVIGWGFVLAGSISLFCSYCHFGRDRYGYTLLSVLCLVWAGVYVCGWLAYDASFRSVGASIIWFLFSGILTVVAGFPNVNMSPPPLLDEDSEEPVVRNED